MHPKILNKRVMGFNTAQALHQSPSLQMWPFIFLNISHLWPFLWDVQQAQASLGAKLQPLGTTKQKPCWKQSRTGSTKQTNGTLPTSTFCPKFM